MPKTIATNSAQETTALGKQFAKQLQPGQFIGLLGELGAGKTQFAKGLAQGLGIKASLTSPTFVLLKSYNQGQLIHIDCYRVANPQEILDLGFDELAAAAKSIVLVEWADKIRSIMPSKTKWIEFKVGPKENQRIIKI